MWNCATRAWWTASSRPRSRRESRRFTVGESSLNLSICTIDKDTISIQFAVLKMSPSITYLLFLLTTLTYPISQCCCVLVYPAWCVYTIQWRFLKFAAAIKREVGIYWIYHRSVAGLPLATWCPG